MENQIDELFRSRLENAELQSGQDLWDHLDEKMVRKRQLRLRFYSAAALILILLVTGLWLLMGPSASLPQQVDQPISKVIKQFPKQEVRNEPVELLRVSQPESAQKVSTKVTVPVIRVEDQHFISLADETSGIVSDAEFSAAEVVSLEPQASAINPVPADEPEVVVYELISLEEPNTSSIRHPGIIRTLMEIKREGISIGPIRDLKNDLINRIFRSRQRNEISNSINTITEQ